jgi:PilZ domain
VAVSEGEDVLTLGESFLLLGFGPAYARLAHRLVGLGFVALRAESLEDALGTLQLADPPVRAFLLPPAPPLPELGPSLRWLAERSLDGNLRAAVVGARPGPEAVARLRGAGVALALFDPSTDGELRFVLNFLAYNPRCGEWRSRLRVPTQLDAQLTGATRAKEARVYNLSADGAYLETPEPAGPGSQLVLELPLPSGPLRVAARVLTSREPSPWHRENLPTGMGVRFHDVGPAAREALERFIDERARSFQL